MRLSLIFKMCCLVYVSLVIPDWTPGFCNPALRALPARSEHPCTPGSWDVALQGRTVSYVGEEGSSSTR